jgi:hypothetical protein
VIFNNYAGNELICLLDAAEYGRRSWLQMQRRRAEHGGVLRVR